MGTDFDVNQWEAGANNHAQGSDFDISKYEGAAPVQASTAPPTPVDPRAQFGKDAMDVLGKVGGRIVDNVKGLPAALNPVPQTRTETGMALAGLPAPITRMVSGVLSALGGATQVPAAISDINASPDPASAYQKAATDTAGDALTMAALEGAGRGVGKLSNIDPAAALEATKDTAVEAGKAAFPKTAKAVREVSKIKERYDAARTKTGTAGQSGTGTSQAPPQDTAPGTKAEPSTSEQSTPQASKSQPVVTDAEAIKSRLNDLLNPPTDADTLKGRLDDLSNPTDGATLKSRLAEVQAPKGEAAYVHQAVKEAGPDATIKEVTSKAQELKTQGDQFEKVFGQPLDSYKNPDGTFNMRDFLQEVVKPGTEPPAHVISRVFGSDGVKLVQDVSGRPIEKWESTGPTKAERAAPKVVEKTASGSPQQYLKLVGADERSILKTPDDMKTVNYFRDKIRKGESIEPSEVHMDENNNVVGADGRHRALAAVKEGVQKVKIKVRRHPFEATR